MIAITRTPTGGSILQGTTRGAGTNQLLKPLGWRWSRRIINSWYLPLVDRPAVVGVHNVAGRPERVRVLPLPQGTAARCAEDLVDLPVGVPDVDLGAAPVTVALHIQIETRGGVVERVAAVEPNK